MTDDPVPPAGPAQARRPRPTASTRRSGRACATEKLLLQRCGAASGWQWGPEWCATAATRSTWATRRRPPRACIYSHQRVWHPVHPALAEQGPYIVVLVELPHADDVRIVGNLARRPAAAVNRYLVESYQLVSGRVAALRTNLSAPVDVQTPASFDEHRKLLHLFERGELAAFETLMTSHIANSGLTYARALEVA